MNGNVRFLWLTNERIKDRSNLIGLRENWLNARLETDDVDNIWEKNAQLKHSGLDLKNNLSYTLNVNAYIFEINWQKLIKLFWNMNYIKNQIYYTHEN